MRVVTYEDYDEQNNQYKGQIQSLTHGGFTIIANDDNARDAPAANNEFSSHNDILIQ